MPIINLDISGTAKLDRASGCFSTVQIDGDVNLSDYDLSELVRNVGLARILAVCPAPFNDHPRDVETFAETISEYCDDVEIMSIVSGLVASNVIETGDVAKAIANAPGMTSELIGEIMAHLYEASREL